MPILNFQIIAINFMSFLLANPPPQKGEAKEHPPPPKGGTPSPPKGGTNNKIINNKIINNKTIETKTSFAFYTGKSTKVAFPGRCFNLKGGINYEY